MKSEALRKMIFGSLQELLTIGLPFSA